MDFSLNSLAKTLWKYRITKAKSIANIKRNIYKQLQGKIEAYCYGAIIRKIDGFNKIEIIPKKGLICLLY